MPGILDGLVKKQFMQGYVNQMFWSAPVATTDPDLNSGMNSARPDGSHWSQLLTPPDQFERKTLLCSNLLCASIQVGLRTHFCNTLWHDFVSQPATTAAKVTFKEQGNNEEREESQQEVSNYIKSIKEAKYSKLSRSSAVEKFFLLYSPRG